MPIKNVHIAVFMLYFLSFTPMTAQNGIYDKLDSLMMQRYAEDSPGAAIYISCGDSVIINKGYGLADLDSKEHIDENTAFNMASVTKQFTVAGILLLQESGLINIDDPLSEYFPRYKSDIWGKIKIRHLMSHSSGIPDLRPRTDREFMLKINDEQSLEYMACLDSLKFEPGTQYDYVNPTFQLLYEIINRVSGSYFEEYQKKMIFDKAQMNGTVYFSPEKDIINMAHGYIRDNTARKNEDSDTGKRLDFSSGKKYRDSKGMTWMEYDYGEETFFGTKSDGGLYSSVSDFVKWERALADNKILSDQSRRLAYTPQIRVSGSPYSSYQNRDNTWYGYGWFLDATPGFPLKIYHTGDNGGFQIYAAKYPKKNILILLFENRNDYDRWEFAKYVDNLLKDAKLLD